MRKILQLTTALLFLHVLAFGQTLTASFSISPLTLMCRDTAFSFDASSTNYTGSGTLSYLWRFGDNAIGTGQKTSHKYSTEGVMDIWLIVSSTDGKIDSVKKQVTVQPIPKAKFGWVGKLCQSEEIQFVDSSELSSSAWIDSWYWVFPDRTSTQQSPLNLFQNPGTYDIKLVIVTNNGCKDSIIRTVTVYAKPKANFTYESQCPGFPMAFTATTTGTVSSHKWVFPDGTSTTGNTTQKTFLKGGIHNVKLVAYNNVTGCHDSINKTVIVYDNSADIVIPNKCGDSAVYLVNKTQLQSGEVKEIIVYWDKTNFSGRIERFKAPFASDTLYQGSVNSTVKYKGKQGSYNVEVQVITSTGCSTTVSKVVQVRGNPKAVFTADSSCLENGVQFKDASYIPTGAGGTVKYWTWFLGDSTAGVPNISTEQNPLYKYKKPGTYKIVLVAASDAGCTDTARGEVKVFPAPVANFEVAQGCRLMPLKFKDTSYVEGGTITKWYWNFGDPGSGSNNLDSVQHPTHVFSDTGTFTVTMVAFSDKGCKDTVKQQVAMYPAPSVAFTYQGNCARAFYYFKDASKAPSGKSISTYKWLFGDGNSSSDKDPVHQYSLPGDYMVSLTVTTSDGCEEKTPLTKITVLESPKTEFFNTPTCVGRPAVFTNNTPGMANGASLTYKWYFGDGNTATTRNATHTYSSAGIRIVSLVVFASNGCRDSVSKLVEITSVPKADFTFTNLCSDSLMQFVDNSTISGGNITQRIWYWGHDDEKTTGNDKNPKHKFPAGGKYTVSLVSISFQGCKDSISKTIETFPEPETKWRYVTHCADSSIQFIDETNMPGGTDTGYAFKWEFGDGNVVYTRHAQHNYGAANGAIYPVKLTVYSKKGCARELTKNVNVYKLPFSNFDVAAGLEQCTGSPNVFYYSGDIAAEKIVDLEWNFGDGTIAYGSDPDPKTYNDSGSYVVTLKATNVYGCVSTTTKTMKILPLPIPKFGWTGGCQGEVVKFRDSSIAFNTGNIRSVNMKFGDGGTTTTLHDSHVYNDTGLYTITYRIKDNRSKCEQEVTKQIRIYPKPQPKFESGVVCFGDPTSLYNKTPMPEEDIAQIIWKFSDGSTTTEFNPTHVFKIPGRDTVEMTVITKIGCKNTIKDTVYTFPKPEAFFTATPNPASILDPRVKFKLLTQNITGFGWTFGDGFSSDETEPEHLYLDTGKYPVMLWVQNANGCRDTMIDTLVVKRDYTLDAPNVLMLNGLNNSWRPIGEGVENYELIIMDRWGQQVFRTEDFYESWKGDYNRNGEKVPEGVYVYYIRIIDFEAQEVKVKKGTINVLR